MSQYPKVRFVVQRYYDNIHGWNSNIDIKLQDQQFKTVEEARHQVKLAQRRFKAAMRPIPKMRILSIATDVVEEL